MRSGWGGSRRLPDRARSWPPSRPWTGEPLEAIPVDFRIDRRRRGADMPEYLSDLGERRTLRQHVGGQRVTESVRSHLRQPGPVTRGAHDHADRVTAQTFHRCSRPQEQSPALSARTAHLEVGGDGPTDISRHRKAVEAMSLSMDDDLSSPPVHVVETKMRHLPRSEEHTSELQS